MKQKKVSITVLLLLCMGITGLYAQKNANAAGGGATGTGGSASYSVGQVAYTYNAAASGSANQGVQQPYEFFTAGVKDNQNIGLSMSVFPNPAQSTVNLKIENQGWENLSFQLYDVNGQQLFSQKVNSALMVVPMQRLAAGSYLLKVSDPQKEIKSFTILKNN
jgi:hypothetical protein